MATLAAEDSVTAVQVGVVTDPGDQRIIRALQLAPRASFARIADVLGLPERTVARRYRALRQGGILRIFAVVNPATAGQHPWSVRVRCRPDSAEALATALAHRSDVHWMNLAAAGSELLFGMHSLSAEQRDTLLMRRLPRSAHVLDINAAVVLHTFAGHHSHDWGGFAHCLDAEETAQLRAEGDVCRDAMPARLAPLDEVDQAIAQVLARDGRATYAQLATAAGISEGRATRRLATLLATGTVFIDLDLAIPAVGFTACAHVFLRVSPGELHQAGETLAAAPEVAFCAAISGPHNLIAVVSCRDLGELYAFTTEQIGSLDGVHGVEISPVLRTIKQAGHLTENGRLVEPAPADGAR